MQPDSFYRHVTGDRLSTRSHSRSPSRRSMRLIMPVSFHNAAVVRNDSRCGRAG